MHNFSQEFKLEPSYQWMISWMCYTYSYSFKCNDKITLRCRNYISNTLEVAVWVEPWPMNQFSFNVIYLHDTNTTPFNPYFRDAIIVELCGNVA